MTNWQKELLNYVKDIDQTVNASLTSFQTALTSIAASLQTIATNTQQTAAQGEKILIAVLQIADDVKAIRLQGQDEVVGIETVPGTPTTNKP